MRARASLLAIVALIGVLAGCNHSGSGRGNATTDPTTTVARGTGAATGHLLYAATSPAIGTQPITIHALDSGSYEQKAVASIPFLHLASFVVAAGAVWASSDDYSDVGRNIIRLDPKTLAVVATFGVKDVGGALFAAGDALFIRTPVGLQQIDPTQNSIGPLLPLDAFPTIMTITHDSIWVLAATSTGTTAIHVGLDGLYPTRIAVDPDRSQAGDIAVAGGTAVASLGPSGELAVIDVATSQVTKRIKVLGVSPVDEATKLPKPRVFDVIRQGDDIWAFTRKRAFRVDTVAGTATPIPMPGDQLIATADGLFSSRDGAMSRLSGDTFAWVDLVGPEKGQLSGPPILALAG